MSLLLRFLGAPPAAPDVPPRWLAQIYRRRGLLRRGELFTTPPVALRPVAVVVRSRRPQRPLLRRGEFFPVVPLVVAAVAPSYPPTFTTSRRRPPPLRRGEFQPVPLVGATPAPPPDFPPTYLEQTHNRPAAVRRGRFLNVALVVATPASSVIPQTITGRRPAIRLRRRGAFTRVIAVAGQPPAVMSQRRRPRSTGRRGQFFICTLQAEAAPPQPSVWRPTTIRGRAFRYQPNRRGRFIEPFLVQFIQDVCPPPTLRPNTGVTVRAVALLARPDTGLTPVPTGITPRSTLPATARPDVGDTTAPAGTTGRPGTGTTVRSAGTTARPGPAETPRPDAGDTETC